jgi:4-diphosphocytidyl-2-C-methyl-D-erythritol kinase
LIVFPNCKINLGLNILRKRRDGYHDLETVFYPIPLTDILEIIEYDSDAPSIPFAVSGLAIEGDPATNLCIEACQLLKNDFPELPAIQMHLHKAIPSGAGLGGGSADAAFTLKLLNKKFGLNLSDSQLNSYAFQLGSDCPFFIINKPCFATGRGELLEEVELSLDNYTLLVINPGIHVETGPAFLQVSPALPLRAVKEIIRDPIESWKNELKNDFEIPAFKKYPELKNIKDQLYQSGAIYASMTGSGSTLYGIFPKEMTIDLSFPSSYFVKTIANN